jgi:hypothetical protein
MSSTSALISVESAMSIIDFIRARLCVAQRFTYRARTTGDPEARLPPLPAGAGAAAALSGRAGAVAACESGRTVSPETSAVERTLSAAQDAAPARAISRSVRIVPESPCSIFASDLRRRPQP